MTTKSSGRTRGTFHIQAIATAVLAVVIVALLALEAVVGLKVYRALGATNAQAQESGARSTRMNALMIGDISLQDDVVASARKDDGTYEFGFVFDHVADQVEGCDLSIVNQESTPGQTKKSTNNDIASALAQEEGKRGFGIVAKPDDSAYLFERNGLKVGVLTYATLDDELGKPSTKDKASTQKDEEDQNAIALPYEQLIRADIAKVRDTGAEMIVVCPRWGNDYDTTPSEAERAYAQLFCDLGVDVVFGCHPQVLQPVELLQNANGHKTACFYSVGAFVPANSTRTETCIGGIARVSLARDDNGQCTVDAASLTPTVICRTAKGHHKGVYPMSDWTYKLARQSEMPYLTPDYVTAYCKRLLGPGFDSDAGVYTLDL